LRSSTIAAERIAEPTKERSLLLAMPSGRSDHSIGQPAERQTLQHDLSRAGERGKKDAFSPE
jgi:hypothetical protein